MELPEPTTVAGRAGLVELIAGPARALVAVDFDGTLAPIVTNPEDARPVPGAVEALRALTARLGTVALITGRPAEFAVEIAGLADVSGLRVLGHYGMEQWYGGALHSPTPDPAVDEVRARLAAVLADAQEGVSIEDKVHSLVVHTRPAADPSAALIALRPRLEQLAQDAGLEAIPGRFAVEIRPAGVDKGSALLALAREREVLAAMFVGDDVGDLAAFAAIEKLRREGVPGITVASVDPAHDDAPHELAARADLVLGGPSAVVEFLSALVAAVGDG